MTKKPLKSDENTDETTVWYAKGQELREVTVRESGLTQNQIVSEDWLKYKGYGEHGKTYLLSSQPEQKNENPR